MRAWVRTVCLIAVCAALVDVACTADMGKAASLADALSVMQSHHFVDLTHAFDSPGCTVHHISFC